MNSRINNKTAIFFSLLAAALYAVSSPLSKLLLAKIPAAMMAALLYLGAGAGMSVIGALAKLTGNVSKEKHLTKKDIPYLIGMVLLDIAAPVCLMIGLSMTTAANTSLLNNFEIPATSIIALAIFKERITKRQWLAMILVTFACASLSVEDMSNFSYSPGSLYVLLACICWGFENNCTRMLSDKNPIEIVTIKGYGSGIGSLLIAYIINQRTNHIGFILLALLLGFISYGLSIYFYVLAQRYLGAAKTSTYYAIAPFIGSFFSLLIFKDIPSIAFIISLFIMITGVYFATTDTLRRSE
jgi:drug/metabolite transporter (DMT)-like permease